MRCKGDQLDTRPSSEDIRLTWADRYRIRRKPALYRAVRRRMAENPLLLA